MSKLSKEQRTILSAVFAITNIGMPMPKERNVQEAFKSKFNFQGTPKTNCHNAVTELGSSFMENEAMQETFADEAYGWYKSLGKMSIEEIKKTWPEHGKLLDLMTEEKV